MSELVRIIDDYRDAHGQPSTASIARAIEVAPQTISSWRTRGIHELPQGDTLRRLAKHVGLPYRYVLEAALIDVGLADGPLWSVEDAWRREA